MSTPVAESIKMCSIEELEFALVPTTDHKRQDVVWYTLGTILIIQYKPNSEQS